MGTVYRAVDETLHREVAIKVLNTELNDPSVARRFRAEAVTVARLNHPGIATIYELFQHDGQWLMVMEFVRGETLEHLSRARARCRSSRRPTSDHADAVGAGARAQPGRRAPGPEAGEPDGERRRRREDHGLRHRARGRGRAPHERRVHDGHAGLHGARAGARPGDRRADGPVRRWAWCSISCVTGRLPFKGDTPIEMAQSRTQRPADARARRARRPARLARAGPRHRAVARPGRRFQTALLFREALRRGLAGLPIETPAPTAIPPGADRDGGARDRCRSLAAAGAGSVRRPRAAGDARRRRRTCRPVDRPWPPRLRRRRPASRPRAALPPALPARPAAGRRSSPRPASLADAPSPPRPVPGGGRDRPAAAPAATGRPPAARPRRRRLPRGRRAAPAEPRRRPPRRRPRAAGAVPPPAAAAAAAAAPARAPVRPADCRAGGAPARRRAAPRPPWRRRAARVRRPARVSWSPARRPTERPPSCSFAGAVYAGRRQAATTSSAGWLMTR